MHNILIKPLLTEKLTNLAAEGKYGFIVGGEYNKIEIAKAVEKKFSVKVDNVRTINYDGKLKTQFRKGGRYTGKTASFKKAIVTLKKGEKIDLFEQS